MKNRRWVQNPHPCLVTTITDKPRILNFPYLSTSVMLINRNEIIETRQRMEIDGSFLASNQIVQKMPSFVQ